MGRFLALLNALGWVMCTAVASLAVFAALMTVFSLFRMPVVPSAAISFGLLLPIGVWLALSRRHLSR